MNPHFSALHHGAWRLPGRGPGLAAGLNVGVEVPRLDVAEYHRPYVAVWIERADASVAATLSVWYDVKMRNAEGTKWLRTCASGGAARAAT